MPPPETQREITILHVDDEPEFLALTKAFLEREQERFVVDTATSVEEARKRLDERSYNVIVSDYQMPGLDGLTFLQQVRERSSTIPFIVFTGKGREEVAIAALNRGANHYLQKGNDIESMYGTLISAIEEVVSKNWALEALRASESEYRSIFETTGTATVIVEEDATLSHINTEFERLSGCSRAEIEGKKKWTEFVVHEDLARMSEYHRLRRKDPNAAPSTYEFRFVDAAGTVKDVLLNINMIAGTKKSVASLLDITQRKKTEEALREAEAKYSAVVENSLDGIAILQDELLKFVNRSYSALMGYTPAEVIGKHFLELVAPEFRELTLKRYTDRLRGKEPPNIYEIAVLHKDGSILPVEINATVMSYEGRPADLVFIRDIADRKRSEDALQANEKRYRELADSLPQVVFEADERGTLTFVNRNAFDVFGYTAEELANGLNALQMIAPEDRDRAARNIQRVLQGESIGGIEYTALREDGSTFPISIHTSRILRETKPVGLRGFLIDQTARKQMEDALRKSEELHRLLTEESPFGVAIISTDGRYRFVNATFVELLGYTLEDIPTVREWFKKAFPEEQAREAARSAWLADLKASKPGEFRPRSFTVTCKDGTQKVICFRSVILSTGEQLVLYEDSTAQKRAKTERAAILKELSAKNRELERFTYTVSHDLRSPLVTIEGFADMLQKDLEQDNHKRVMSDLQYISTAAARMDELLSTTLKLSRIGRMTNPPEDVPFGTLVQDALAQTVGEIQASGVEVVIADHFPSVHVDRLGIAELLVNLISNSIKYRGDRPDPRIELGHRMDGDETVFFVKDNGIGIDESEHEKVFEIFYQVDTRSEGTGAGLAIVRRIVEMHGGRIWIESEVGKGCTVCFTLPMVRADL